MKHCDLIRTTAIVWLIFVLAAPFAHAKDAQLSQLMQLLAQNKSAKATYVERTYIGIIDRPLVSTGELSFVAPDSLEKRVLTPKPELLILRGDTLTIERPGKRRIRVSLEEYPEISAFIESIRGTLAGDLHGLKTFYALQLTGSIKNWRLVLTPKQQRLSHIFRRIRISGSHANVKTIELDQQDGDRSVMVITQVSNSR
ncbi:MAG: LolA-related protein [Acidiferrobacterales bacterium]